MSHVIRPVVFISKTNSEVSTCMYGLWPLVKVTAHVKGVSVKLMYGLQKS